MINTFKLLTPVFFLLIASSCNESTSDSNDNYDTQTELDKQNNSSEGEYRYSALSKEAELFGSWSIENSFTSDRYDYEIFVADDQYTGVKLSHYTFENLTKEGEKFIVEDNEYGEYYTIDNDKNMIMYDKDGSLESAGYIVKKN